ncbi:ABC transporter substrate-binding protein [Desulfobulbus sp.]|uniref:substrate-binding periplasmic protein n=1 Tax=Desulfobulbus sp. TaxID=895 RepID=UPI0027BA28F6|nr:transporter substrate-binding domain-containing protein [Desulfobulbus sp.]
MITDEYAQINGHSQGRASDFPEKGEVYMKFCTAVLIAICLFSQVLAAEPPLVIGTADGVPLSTSDGMGFHDQIVREAFRRIGLQIDIAHLPAERALLNANEGIEKGIYVRIQGLESEYKNLSIVPEKISEYEFVAFGKDPSLRMNGWDSLQNYHVGIVNGWKILEKNIVACKNLTKVKNAEVLFRSLEEDKIDLVVYNKIDGYGMIKELGLQGIHALDSPFATKDMFLYLHKDLDKVILPLAEALKAIKSDGTYLSIKRNALSQYLPESEK